MPGTAGAVCLRARACVVGRLLSSVASGYVQTTGQMRKSLGCHDRVSPEPVLLVYMMISQCCGAGDDDDPRVSVALCVSMRACVCVATCKALCQIKVSSMVEKLGGSIALEHSSCR